MANPTIKKEQFEALGFKQYSYVPDNDTGGVWSVRYFKDLNPDWLDQIEIFWTCCNGRYLIMRQTKNLKNIFFFEGFLKTISDLEYLLPLFDVRRFYEDTPKPLAITPPVS
jgi:hypothetical protein